MCVYVCAFNCVCGCVNTYTYILMRVCVYCISVCMHVCQSCGPVVTRNPAGRKSECIHPGSQGPGATQVPSEGMKGCSADVTRWGSVAQPANVMFGSWHAAALPPVVGRGIF